MVAHRESDPVAQLYSIVREAMGLPSLEEGAWKAGVSFASRDTRQIDEAELDSSLTSLEQRLREKEEDSRRALLYLRANFVFFLLGFLVLLREILFLLPFHLSEANLHVSAQFLMLILAFLIGAFSAFLAFRVRRLGRISKGEEEVVHKFRSLRKERLDKVGEFR